MQRRGSLMVGALLIGAATISQTAHAQSAPPTAEANEPLLLEIVANGHVLSDGSDAIQTPDGKVYLPPGELGRLLGVEISVDAAAGSIRTSKDSQTLAPGSFLRAPGDTYVRTDVLEELLAISIQLDLPGLSVAITSKSRFPFEFALEREEQRARLDSADPLAADPGPIREAPYEAFTPPAFDVMFDGDARDDGHGLRSELRAAGDLLFAGYQLYLNTDYHLHPRDLRFTIDRRDFDGGPLGLTRIAAGDVFTPNLSLGPRPIPGRGVFLSNEPLQTVSIFDQLDLRGELPAGWEVELYINEVLSGSQGSSGNGLYEFREVPLTYGRNLIRLRFYGPHGEQREEVRNYMVGGGQVPKGQFVYNLGVLADGHPLIRLPQGRSGGIYGTDGLKYSANIAYGVSPWLTLTGGIGTYQPADKKLFVANVGARTALGAYSVQVDGALDDEGGRAVSAAVAGPFLGGSIVARHAEYGDGFIDQGVSGGGRALRRSTEVRVSQLIHMGKLSVPISLLLDHDVLSDGTPLISAHLQTTLGWGGTRASMGLDYYRDGDGDSRLGASTDLYILDFEGWRLHSTALTRLVPDVALDSLQISAERSIGLSNLLHFGLTRQFRSPSSSTIANASFWVRGRLFDLSLDANYDFNRDSFRIGGRFAFGFLYDPLQGRYVIAKPGMATTGAIALNAFKDLNGDGVRQPQEPGVQNLSLSAGSTTYPTDERGYALVPGIGTGLVPVKVTAELSDEPVYLPETLKFRAGARPGKVMVIDYPVAFLSEVSVHAVQAGPVGAANRAEIPGLRLALVSRTGRRFTQTTADDGGAYFTDLPPGEYRLEIDKDQAEELGARISSQITISALPEGGVMLPVDVSIEMGATDMLS